MSGLSWLRSWHLNEADRWNYRAALIPLWILFPALLLFNVSVGHLLGIEVHSFELMIICAIVGPLAAVFTFPLFNPLLSSMLNSLLFLALVAPLLTAYTYLTAALGAEIPLY